MNPRYRYCWSLQPNKTIREDKDISRTRKKKTGPNIVWLWTKYKYLSMYLFT